MNFNDFPHIQLLKESGKKFLDLSADIKTLLTDFESKFKNWNIKKSPAGLEVLQAQSRILSQNIYDYFVDEEDQSIENAPATTEELLIAANEIKAAEDHKEDVVIPVVIAASATPILNSLGLPAVEPVITSTLVPLEPVLPIEPVESKPSPYNTGPDKAINILFEQGKEIVTKEELKAAGFNTSFSGPLSYRGCETHFFKLIKTDNDSYKIVKK
jgi:hypothetical protein